MTAEDYAAIVKISLERAVAQAESVKVMFRRQIPINGGRHTAMAMLEFNRRVSRLRWGLTTLENNEWLIESFGDDFLAVLGLEDDWRGVGEN